ncbi:putative acetyltransferase [Actinomycetospora sp. NBRC 106375]|nr:putative acetyltransferase [Actinomycetospora sp. NBRC 106375]
MTDDVDEFWRATHDHLRAHRVASTVVLSAVDRLRARGSPDGIPELAWWTDGAGVGATVIRTPPHRPVVSAMPDDAARAWAAHRPPPAWVMGPPQTVDRLASAWGATVEVAVRERLHRLAALVPPPDPTPTRPAADAERECLSSWWSAFHREATPDSPPPPREAVDAAVDDGRVLVAVDGDTPVAWAVVGHPVLGVSRIGPVYTLPAHRGRGHGAAVTAAVARLAGARGADEVLLFTDLANPTSNALYARLGFVGVQDVIDARLRSSTRG